MVEIQLLLGKVASESIWKTLPLDSEQVKEVIDEIGLSNEQEININGFTNGDDSLNDYYNRILTNLCLSRPFSEVNELAALLEEKTEEQVLVSLCLLDNRVVTSVDGVENVLRNKSYCVYYDCYNMAQVAEQYYKSLSSYESEKINDILKLEIDWEKEGSKLLRTGEFFELGFGKYLQVYS